MEDTIFVSFNLLMRRRVYKREREGKRERDKITRHHFSVVICYFSFLDTAQARNVQICAGNTLKRYVFL